jgi:hypothetical protein
VILAEAHGWTPEQIDRMDPDFITELFAYKDARATHQEADADRTDEQRKAEQRRRTISRKLNKMDRRGNK